MTNGTSIRGDGCSAQSMAAVGAQSLVRPWHIRRSNPAHRALLGAMGSDLQALFAGALFDYEEAGPEDTELRGLMAYSPSGAL